MSWIVSYSWRDNLIGFGGELSAESHLLVFEQKRSC